MPVFGKKIISKAKGILNYPELANRHSDTLMELADIKEKYAMLTEENAGLKGEIAALKNRLETENAIYQPLIEPFNEYIKAKAAGNEGEIYGTLAAFLLAVLDVGRGFYANSLCEGERELFLRFADEQRRVFTGP